MSILIKGMITPSRCDMCSMRAMGVAWCMVAKRSTSHSKTGKPLDETRRPKWCPIVEVPVPHGRLIDERVAYDKIAEQEGGNYIDMDAVDSGLQETPTVIEADGE